MGYKDACTMTDNDLAALRRKLTGSATLGVFTKDGNGLSFDGVDTETISYFEQGGVWYLRFENGVRATVVPNVTYWTEQ